MSRTTPIDFLLNITEDPDQLITIGITCFNSEQTIARAIRSALDQDWPVTEIIIVDDCSSDGSVAAVRQAIAGCENVRLIQHVVNGGPAKARNSILAAARGTFIVFFDDDDISFPQRLRLQYQRLIDFEVEMNATKIFCFASGRRRYSNGYEFFAPAIGSQEIVPHGAELVDYLLFNRRNPGVYYGSGVPACAFMARTETVLSLGGFDEDLRRVEDVDLAIRLALSGGWFIGCVEVLYLQFATDGFDKTPLKNLEAELVLTDKYADHLNRSGSLRYAKDWFHIRYYHFTKKRIKFCLALLWFLMRFPLRGSRHLLRSGPARVIHERRMRRL